jgi:hypothetical protein
MDVPTRATVRARAPRVWGEKCDSFVPFRNDKGYTPKNLRLSGAPVHARGMFGVPRPTPRPGISEEVCLESRRVIGIDKRPALDPAQLQALDPYLRPMGVEDPLGNEVHDTLDLFTLINMGTNQQRDFITYATKRRAYWMLVYENPRSHADILHDLTDLSVSAVQKDIAIGELSREVLALVADRIVGLEIIREHEPSSTLGVVIAGYQEPVSGSLLALVRPFETGGGRVMSTLLEFGVNRGCSLRHVTGLVGQDHVQYVQLHELSICLVGRRPNTWLQCVVDLGASPPLDYNSRIFEPPVFMYSKTSAQETRVPVRRPDPSRAVLGLDGANAQFQGDRMIIIPKRLSRPCRDTPWDWGREVGWKTLPTTARMDLVLEELLPALVWNLDRQRGLLTGMLTHGTDVRVCRGRM